MEIITLSALVVALTQVVKMTFNLNTRFAPLTAICISEILIFAFAYFSHVPILWDALQNGLIAGLSAVGLWSGVSTTFKS